MQSLFGVGFFLFIAWLVSERRRVIPWRIVLAGLGLQVALAGLFLSIPDARELFLHLNAVVEVIESSTKAGTSFVFGYLGGGELPFQEPYSGAAYVFAFRGLPIILFMSALTAALFYLGLLQWVVGLFSWLLQRTLGIGGAVGLGTAANVFVGMIEAPLFIRPYLASLTRSELFMLMTAGMATIAGTMLVLYANILAPVLPDSLGHILVASIISAPASLLIAALMVPPDARASAQAADSTNLEKDGISRAIGKPVRMEAPAKASNLMDAIAQGASQGVMLFLHVAATLIVLVAMVALANHMLGLLPAVGESPITLQRAFGWGLAPVAWCMGLPWAECQAAGQLLGTKVVLNEFIAYLDLAKLPPETFQEKSRLILNLRHVRLRQLRQLGHPAGRHGADASGTPRRDRRLGDAFHPRRHACHLHDGQHRRPVLVIFCPAAHCFLSGLRRSWPDYQEKPLPGERTIRGAGLPGYSGISPKIARMDCREDREPYSAMCNSHAPPCRRRVGTYCLSSCCLCDYLV